MKEELRNVLGFLSMLHTFQNVERMIPVCDKERLENDAEHSYSLTMLAWYMVEKLNLPLDTEKVLKYALVHDIVEVHAGDTYVFDIEKAQDKHEREQVALKRLHKDFPDFPSLARFIEKYENQVDEESVFVYALDKFVPVLTIYLASKNKKSFWQEHEISYEKLVEMKDTKIALSPVVNTLWQEFKNILKKEEKALFSTP